MEPMVRALKPLANFSDWLWDFHINGEGRDLTFSIHKEPWTDRNITNAQYAQDLTDNFTRWQKFFDEEGGFFKCGNFEQNGGSHDMSRALGNARNSVTLGLLGDSVRMSTGANALQLMGHQLVGNGATVSGHARSLFGRAQIITRDPRSGVLCAGLSTTVLPMASAGASLVAAINSGQFHGTMSPQTPSGS